MQRKEGAWAESRGPTQISKYLVQTVTLEFVTPRIKIYYREVHWSLSHQGTVVLGTSNLMPSSSDMLKFQCARKKSQVTTVNDQCCV